ncbi:MAG: TrkH family potassium uptake protein [Proteobacteria bacterium]|nr:TrkH family potassium uptake protein [Pseudomonadota bacterium]MBU1389296.1 TrkH family potassium uptake protein [Pseudomonadota bacterium]MBU1544116.1 TrkH family potassium uptake protein [Pseudomonadota bacterium]MBU2429484.1 TrkH family potassium uptake protein [Pseudomonadota bacterium]MBU2481624.1 TrkH family potassium uptake protein [Pseudomonadota bacterium]
MKAARNSLRKSLSQSPTRILILGYMLLILLGSLLLMLPRATRIQGHLPFIDALFTSASAVCVTGLTVVDTAGTFSFFGQIILVLLIQTGGLGIMVVSTVFILSLGKKVGLTGKTIMRDTYSFEEGREIFSLLKEILLFTLSIEFIGALVLFLRFRTTQSISEAAFNAVFHAISAFCNAGFSLFTNSFMNYYNDWIVSLTICFLIILGGIGFIVLSEVKTKISFSKKSRAFFSLHTKLVLSSTLLLLIFSTCFFIFLEWHNFAVGMTLPEKCLAGFFQAVNARTSGFNSLPIENLTNGTLFMIILLMFIGAAPGSCGGGVKITTFSSLVLLGYSRLKGDEYPQIFYRKISNSSIAKATSVVMISLLVIIFGIIILQQTEIGGVFDQTSRGAFLELMFETVSAFGTVGLSMGVTPTLSIQGKIVITIMMFIGRLGPVAIALGVSTQKAPKRYHYAQENIMIG